MSMYKPSELRLFLNSLGIAPKKGMSQNFLIDGNIVRKIVASAHVEKGDVVLEIGPGPGSLTEELLNAGATVLAVEKDDILAKALDRLQTEDDRLHVFCEDFLLFDLESQLKKILTAGKKAKVIANLPYHLTTPILALLIPHHALISSLTVMVQEEVGRRMTAHPNTSEYSSFTVFLKFYSEPSYAFNVTRQCFYPVPNVDSCIVSLKLQESALPFEQHESFFKITRTAFEHRRKMLRASLRELYPPALVTESLIAIGQDPLARPEALSLHDFIQLHAYLTKNSTSL